MIRPLIVAFDMDDTLIIPAVAGGFDTDVPNYETIAIYRWFQTQGNTMVIWSGGGADYAQRWAEKLGLRADYYFDKHLAALEHSLVVDLAFDDSDLALATVNVKVRRMNNHIVRYPDRVKKRPSVADALAVSSPANTDDTQTGEVGK